MTFPPPEALVRHRPPALLVTMVDACDGQSLTSTSVRAALWRWPELLDAAAQAAGMLFALARETSDPTHRRGLVVARYDAVSIFTHAHTGNVTWQVRTKRRIGDMKQLDVTGEHQGRPILSATITLAPEPMGA